MIYINDKLAINFKRGSVENFRGSLGPRLTTVCELVDLGKDKTVLYSGVAYCQPPDPFTKERGRKESLRKVLKNSGFDRKQREAVWDAYLNRNWDAYLNRKFDGSL